MRGGTDEFSERDKSAMSMEPKDVPRVNLSVGPDLSFSFVDRKDFRALD